MSNKPHDTDNSLVKEAKLKAAHYCAYQERTQQQVRNKLYDLGLRTDDVEEVISDLITEGFINEERFAVAFAGGRFRLKKWGKLKIERELRNRGLSDYCVQKGLIEIEDDEYRNVAHQLIQKKWDSLSGSSLLKMEKTKRFMAGKGYEFELINDILNEIA